MSEKKRARRRKDEYSGPGEAEERGKPSKDEYNVAKWMKKNVKTKKTKFLNHSVEYFTSNKAIDALMKSKFATSDTPLFASREQAVEFLDLMLEHKFYHRALKVPVTAEELRLNTGKSSTIKKDEKSSKKRDEKAEKKDLEVEAEASGTNGTDEANGEKKEKRKRKIRLDMHPEQVFVDGSEAYVWIYDPIPLHYWIYGLVLLLGAIGICLFPLWPPMLRKGVYYLSIVAAGFLGFILILTVVRLIIFTIAWAMTGGKLHFWIFPNLTEDVGFFASFWPLYESKYSSDDKSKSKGAKKSKAKKKEKDSDNEDEIGAEETPLEPEKIEEIKEHDAEHDIEMELRHRKAVEEASLSSAGDNSDAAAESDAKGSRTPSESESESSGPGNDYIFVKASDVDKLETNNEKSQ